MEHLFINYGHKRHHFQLPSDWKLLTFAGFTGKAEERAVGELVRRALRKPINALPLKESLPPEEKVAILVEDLTRPSPKALILKVLLEELAEAGLPEDRISIVLALGTHRGLTSEEMEATFGRDLLRRYKISNHDCRAPDLVPAARLKTGREVKINRLVRQAGFRIGLGSIFPHPMNGFGGGGKILFPGVADFEAILDHHLTYTFHEGTGLGKIERNRFYEEVCFIARSAGLDFIVNSVLDQNDQVYDVVAGDPVQAHLAGIKTCQKITSQRFLKKGDLTLITSFPYKEGPQIVKPLAPASLITREGGCIILAADCSGNLPEAFIAAFERFHARYKNQLLKGVLEHFNRKRLIMPEGAIDFNMALAMTLAVQDKFKTILLSEDIPRETAQRMGFHFAENLKEAFAISARFCPQPEVQVVPSGGVILPELPGGF